MKKIVILLVILLSSSCNNRRDNFFRDHVVIDVTFPDTLDHNKEYGKLSFCNKFSDTLKRHENDDRFIRVYLNIFDKPKNKINFKEELCDTFVGYSKNINDTLRCKFYINTDSIENGKKYLCLKIVDKVYLNGYSENDSTYRYIENTYYSNYPVYLISGDSLDAASKK